MSSITPPSEPGSTPSPTNNASTSPVKPFPKKGEMTSTPSPAGSGDASEAAAPAGPSFSSTDNFDPTGIWTRFLSTPGHPATEKQVKMFIEGLMKQLALQIQHEMRRAKEAAERMKRAADGEE